MKKYFCLILIVFLVAVLNCGLASAQTDASIAKARNLMEEFRNVSGIPGITVAVGKNGEIIWNESFGSRDVENRVSATSDTRFRLGSVSKLFTIAALARLYEKGKVDLDAPIGTYVRYIPEEYKKLTTRQLAGHLAGVRHYLDKDFANDVKHFKTVKESTRVFTGDPLLHPAGTKYLYSTFGYVLLSAVLEEASGKEFLQLLHDEVYQPLKLRHSGPDILSDLVPGRTRYYDRKGGAIKNASYEDPSYKWGAGGIISTADDLVRLGTAHLKPGYLQPETLKVLFTSQTTTDGKETGVGIGWRIGTDWTGRKVYHHAGSISGGRAVLILYPEENLVISLATNLGGEPPLIERTAQMIADLFLSKNARAKVPADFTGSYAMSGTQKEKSFSANLVLKRNSDNFSGELTGGFPLLDIAEKNQWPTKITVADVFKKDNTIVVVLASAFGLIDLRLQPNGEEYFYILDVGPSKIEGTLTAVKN